MSLEYRLTESKLYRAILGNTKNDWNIAHGQQAYGCKST